MFKTHFSGSDKIWRAKKNLGDTAPESPWLRAWSEQNMSTESGNDNRCHSNSFRNCLPRVRKGHFSAV